MRFSDLKFNEIDNQGGVQALIKLVRFDISIVCHKYSYGGPKGFYEIGVFWTSANDCYDKYGDRFDNTVQGWLSKDGVTNVVNNLLIAETIEDDQECLDKIYKALTDYENQRD